MHVTSNMRASGSPRLRICDTGIWCITNWFIIIINANKFIRGINSEQNTLVQRLQTVVKMRKTHLQGSCR